MPTDTTGERVRFEAAERLVFEAFISAPPFEFNIARIPNDPDEYAWPGQYVDREVSVAWESWCARALLEKSKEPVPGVRMLTEDEVLAAIHSRGPELHGRIALTFESGPYCIDRPTLVADGLAVALQRKFCEVNGISFTEGESNGRK